MAAMYWIKLYHEILDDYKMGTLPDNLWRRSVELFLYAGELAQDGLLPEVEVIAYRLRLSVEQMTKEIEDLKNVKIITEKDGRLWVTNFGKRQARVSDAERKRRQRERDKGGHAPVTKRDTDKIRIDTDTDKDKITELYESNIGPLVPLILDDLKLAIEKYSPSWIEDAIKIAVEKDARNWKYIKAILKNWEKEGRKTNKKGEQSNWEKYLDGEFGDIIQH